MKDMKDIREEYYELILMELEKFKDDERALVFLFNLLIRMK